MKKILLFGFLLGILFCKAQSKDYWQQHVDYKMDVKMDVKIKFMLGFRSKLIHFIINENEQ
jgi:hypothetical protein